MSVSASFYADMAITFRGGLNALTLEGALKLKKIMSELAGGFATGELKHGSLAPETDQTPVYAVVREDNQTRKTIGNTKEIEARGAPVVAVTDGQSDVDRYADSILEIPATHPWVAPILANIQFQLVAYHAANELGRSIDKPLNLAKSITVE